MRNIIFTLKDIRRQKKINFILLLQVIVMFILITDICDNVVHFRNGYKRLQYLSENSGYVNSDTTDINHMNSLWSKEEESIEKANDLYNFIKKNYSTYTVWQYASNKIYDGENIIQYFADKYYFKILGIEFYKGDFLEEVSNKQVIPVVIGYDLRNKYAMGREYKIFNCALNTYQKVKVTGILEPNATNPSLFQIGSSDRLSKSIIFPITDDYMTDLANLDMAINATVIFSTKKEKLKRIEQKSAEYNLFSMNYGSIDKNIQEYREILDDKLKSRVITIGVILLFSMSSMILYLLELIELKRREFAIHLILGAKKSDIFLQIVYHIGILLLPALCISYIWVEEKITYLFLAIFTVMLCLVTVVVPIVKIKNKNIIMLYQKGEQL